MRRLSVLLLALAVLGCHGEPVAPNTLAPQLLPSVPPNTVRGYVLVLPREGDVTVLHVRIEANGLVLGAYQGNLTFNPGALEIIGSNDTEVDFQAVNLDRAASGQVRFAAFTATGFKTTLALDLVVRTKRPLTREDATLALNVIGTLDGSRVDAQRIQILPTLVDYADGAR